MGFGFVNFEINDSAARAVEALNGFKLREGKIMKVSIARPAWKANIHSNLYVSGFPNDFVESDLMDLLGVHAKNAENVRLLRDADRKLRGAAVVRMSSEDAASSLISALNGIPIPDASSTRTLNVRPWRPEFRAERVSDEAISGSLSTGRRKGRDPRPNSYTHPSLDAQQLLQQMTYNYHRRRTQLPPATETPETYQTDDEEENLATLFVFHLPSNIHETVLAQIFSQFGGEIESLQVFPNKGYGFISYYRPVDAIVAMTHLNGYLFPGSNKPVRIELKQ